MARKTILSILLFLALMVSCTKENGDFTTTFQGVVLYEDSNEPFTNGQIEIIGYKALSEVFNKSFPISPDGTFNLKVSRLDASIFSINLTSNDFRDVYQSCTGTGISQYCTLMEAGKDYTNITVLASPVD